MDVGDGAMRVILRKIIDELFVSIAGNDYNVDNIIIAKSVDNSADDGFTGHGQQRFMHCIGKRSHSITVSRGQNNGFHVHPFLIISVKIRSANSMGKADMGAGIYIYAFNFIDRNTAKPMSRNLVMVPSWIGDCVLALSVVHNKILTENADITLLASPALAALCAQLTPFTIIPYKRKTRGEFHATLATVKAKKFSKVYVLPQSFSSAWFSFRSRIKLRRGVSRELREIFFNEPLPRKLRTSARHITYEYALVLETAYCPPDYWQGVRIDKSALSAGAIILCPGSKYGPTKKWPWYSELVEKLPGKKIILLETKTNEKPAKPLKTREATGWLI